MVRVTIQTIAAMLAVATASAGPGTCIRQTRSWGGDGPATVLVVAHGHAFFGGHTVRIADLADPTRPVVVNEVRTGEAVVDLAVAGDRVLVVDGTSNVHVIDAEEPATASIVGRVAAAGTLYSLHQIDTVDDLGAVLGQSFSPFLPPTVTVAVLDLDADAALPETVGSIELPGTAEFLAMGEGFVAVADRSDWIRVVDISDPAAPVSAAEVPIGYYLVGAEVRELAAEGNLLAIAASNGRISLIDITDPWQPVYRGVTPNLDIGVPSITFEGPMIHAAGHECSNSGVCGGYALVNALAPTSPVVAGRTDGPLMLRPAPHNGHVVTASFRAGLRVVDLAGISNPTVLDVTLPARDAGAFSLAGDLIYVVDETDLSDPEDPDRNRLVILQRGPHGELEEVSVAAPEGAIWAVAADGEWAAMAVFDEAAMFDSVEIIDASTPSAPVVGVPLGAALSLSHETFKPHLEVVDGRMVLSLDGSDDVLLYDLTGGGGAVQVGTVRPRGELVDVALASRSLLAVAVQEDDIGWIDLVDTSDPAAPTVVSTVAMPSPTMLPLMVEADGDWLAFLVAEFDTWNPPASMAYVVDASDPAHPIVELSPVAGPWIVLGGGLLHTEIHTYPPSQPWHGVVDATSLPGVVEGESAGSMEAFRWEVDADGALFAVAMGRLDVHHYGICRTIADPHEGSAAVD